MWVSVVRSSGTARACVWSAWSLVVLATAACGNTQRNTGNPTGSAAAGGGSAGANSGGADSGGSGAAGAELQALPSELHRLNASEYRATVGDVLGASPALLLPRDGEASGYDNIAAAQGMDAESFDLYYAAARLVASEVFASEALKAKLVSCQAADDAACVRSVIAGAGLRLFRRPLLDSELAPYAEVYTAARARGDSHDDALELTLVGLLSSAQFLYRMELVGESAGTQPLSPYEIASRLSYLLWSSAPDEALLSAAEGDSLSQDAGLSATLTRMWADPKSERFVKNFAGQWLGARRLATHVVDAGTFPDWSAVVASAAEAEVYDAFGDLLRQDRSWDGFLTGRAHTVDGALASYYGLPQVGAGTQVLLPDGERAGFLGSVAFLTASSLDRRTSPTLRGRFILARLLCQEPAPPVGIPELTSSETEGLNLRQRVERISDDPGCKSCHELMDPLGLAFEHYDGVGRYRTTYAEDGTVVDSNVRLAPSTTYPEGLAVSGVGDVVQALANDPALASCFVRNLYTYGLGRVMTSIDEGNTQLLAEQWQAGTMTVKALVEQLVLAKPFRYRSDGGRP